MPSMVVIHGMEHDKGFQIHLCIFHTLLLRHAIKLEVFMHFPCWKSIKPFLSGTLLVYKFLVTRDFSENNFTNLKTH